MESVTTDKGSEDRSKPEKINGRETKPQEFNNSKMSITLLDYSMLKEITLKLCSKVNMDQQYGRPTVALKLNK